MQLGRELARGFAEDDMAAPAVAGAGPVANGAVTAAPDDAPAREPDLEQSTAG